MNLNKAKSWVIIQNIDKLIRAQYKILSKSMTPSEIEYLLELARRKRKKQHN